jgi:hypothetical protein
MREPERIIRLRTAQVSKDAIDMDRTRAKSIRQVRVGQGALVSGIGRQAHHLQALTQLKKEVSHPFDSIPATKIQETLHDHGLVA